MTTVAANIAKQYEESIGIGGDHHFVTLPDQDLRGELMAAESAGASIRSIAATQSGIVAQAWTILSHPEARRSLISLLDQAIVSGTSFATTVILGRLCQPGEIGIYFLALTVVWLAQDVCWEIVSTPYQILNHRRKGARLARYTGSTFAHQMVLSLFVIAGLLIYYTFLSTTVTGSDLMAPILVLVGALPLLLFREFIRQLCFGRLKSSVALAIDATVATLQLGGFGLLAYANMLTAASAYCVMGASCGIAALAWLLLKQERLEFRPKSVAVHWKRNWRFGRWMLISMLLGRATSYIMPWIILWAYDAEQTALLGMCITLIGVPNMVILAMGNCLRPRLFRDYAEGGLPKLRRMLLIATSAFAIPAALFLVAVLILGDRIGTTIYGPACVGSGMILAVLAIGTLSGGAGMALAAGLCAVDRPQDNLMPNAWDLLLTLGGAALLVPSWGVIGAAAATAMGNVAGTAVRWHKLRAPLRLPAIAEVGGTA